MLKAFETAASYHTLELSLTLIVMDLFYLFVFTRDVKGRFLPFISYISKPVLNLVYTFQFSIRAQFLDAKNTLFI